MDKKPAIPDVLPRFAAYRSRHGAWGALHVVLDDGNVSDDSVRYCLDAARDAGDCEGAALAQILLMMSKTQRLKLGAPGTYSRADG